MLAPLSGKIWSSIGELFLYGGIVLDTNAGISSVLLVFPLYYCIKYAIIASADSDSFCRQT